MQRSPESERGRRRTGRITLLLVLAAAISGCSAAKPAPASPWQRRSSPDAEVAAVPSDDQLARDQRECERAVALSNLDGVYARGMMIQCLEDRGWEQQASRHEAATLYH
ncbi:MAG TPA: hypothetical protein VEI94_15050 [Candidatus Bathyarchaeia archaeon]|nr:hypothetical protein [Candidatus Bathyarchaeia archaeon]